MTAIKPLSAFYHEVWNVGVVHQEATDIVARGLVEPVHWLSPPPEWTFLADPSCRVHEDGGLTLYAEKMDYWIGRGEIWSTYSPPGADPALARFSPLLEAGVHLSYPFPFVDNEGRSCMTAESWEAGAAWLWQEQGSVWSLTSKIFDGRPVVDPTLWRGDDRWWLFCTFQDDGPNEKLHLFHAPRVSGPWAPHRCNPIVSNNGSARPGGPLFWADGTLVRPSQDCSCTYGGALMLNAVTRLDSDLYSEKPIRSLEPLAPYSSGLHTFCPAGKWTLIDGKRWQFHLLEPARKVLLRSWRRLLAACGQARLVCD
jgi:hypothetical protein